MLLPGEWVAAMIAIVRGACITKISGTFEKVTHVVDEEPLYEEKNACDVVEREQIGHWCYPC